MRGGIRYDSYSNEKNSLTPRAAAIYNPYKSTTVKLLYGEAFRVPTIYEKYYSDSYSGYKNSLSLSPEKIRTVELVVEQRVSQEIFCVGSLYNYRMSDLIDTKIDAADNLKQFQNVGIVNASGIELEVNGRFMPGISGYINYSMQAANDEQSSALTNQPAHLVKAGASFPISSFAFFSLDGRYETKRKTVYNAYTDSYALLHGNVTYKILGNILEASLRVKNIFNTRYSTPGGFEHIQQQIEQDGRTLLFRLSYRPW